MEGLDKTLSVRVALLGGLGLMALGGLWHALTINKALYSLIIAGVGLLMVTLALIAARQQVAKGLTMRATRLGLGSVVSVLAVFALLIFLGAIFGKYHLRFDFSPDRTFSLAPQTRNVLAKLKTDVKAYAFLPPAGRKEFEANRRAIIQLLDRYAAQSKRFKYEAVDLNQRPDLAKKMKVRRYGSLVLVAGKRTRKVDQPAEKAITNAIVAVSKKGKKKIYFVLGHGEGAKDNVGNSGLSRLSKELENESYDLHTINLAAGKGIPPDASVLIIAGPKKPLNKVEKERLAAYLKSGGGVLVLLDPQQDGGLAAWLKQWGLELKEDLVLDRASQAAGASPAMPITVFYELHDITRPMESVSTYYPLVRSVHTLDKLPKGISAQVLVRASQYSWGETDLKSIRTGAKFEKGKDTPGPVPLAAIAMIPAKKGKGRLVVFGDSDFASNAHLLNAGNRDLVLNTISYLAQEPDLISIRATRDPSEPMFLNYSQNQLRVWLPIVVFPLVFLILGIWIIVARRRSR